MPAAPNGVFALRPTSSKNSDISIKRAIEDELSRRAIGLAVKSSPTGEADETEQRILKWIDTMRNGSYNQRQDHLNVLDLKWALDIGNTGDKLFSRRALSLYKRHKDEILDILITAVSEYKEEEKRNYEWSFSLVSTIANALYISGQKELFSELIDKMITIRFPSTHAAQFCVMPVFLNIISLDTTATSKLTAFLIAGIAKKGYYIREEDSGVYFALIDVINSLKRRSDYYLIRMLTHMMLRDTSGEANVGPDDPLRVRTRSGSYGIDINGVLRDSIHNDLGVYCVGLLERMLEYYRSGDLSVLSSPEYQVDYFKNDNFAAHNVPYPDSVTELRRGYDVEGDGWHKVLTMLFDKLSGIPGLGDTNYERLRNIDKASLDKVYARIEEESGISLGRENEGVRGGIVGYIWAYRTLAARYNRGSGIDFILGKLAVVGNWWNTQRTIYGAKFSESELYNLIKAGRMLEAAGEIARARERLNNYIFSGDIRYDPQELRDRFTEEWGRDDAGNAVGGAHFYDRRFELYRIDFYLSMLEREIIPQISAERFNEVTSENITDAIKYLDILISISRSKGMASLSEKDYAEYLLWQDTTLSRARDIMRLIQKEAIDDKNYIFMLFADVLKEFLKEDGADFDDPRLLAKDVRGVIGFDSTMPVLYRLEDKIALFLHSEAVRVGDGNGDPFIHSYGAPIDTSALNRYYMFGRHVELSELEGLIDNTGRGLLGSKGIGTVRLLKEGLNTAAGFILPAGIAADSLSDTAKAGLKDLAGYLRRNKDEPFSGCTFGSVKRPLLVSVRPGAFFVMPGQMATVTNMGLNEDNIAVFVDYLISRYGMQRKDAEWTAWDSYRRFLESYGSAVYGMGHEIFDDIIENMKRMSFNLEHKEDMSPAQMELVAKRYKRVIEESHGKRAIPKDLKAQFRKVVLAARSSWARSAGYRRLKHLEGSWPGAAVIVQAMLLGNLRNYSNSGAGVAYSRDPNTGMPGLRVEFKDYGQGEDLAKHTSVVRTLDEADSSIAWMAGLAADIERLDGMQGSIVEGEFTIEGDERYYLQVRHAIIPPKYQEFLFVPTDESLLIKTGESIPSSGGACTGKVFVARHHVDIESERGRISRLYDEAVNEGLDGVILVIDDLGPEEFTRLVEPDDDGIIKIAGICTKRGGMFSHSADMARDLMLNAIVGIEALTFALDEEGESTVCFLAGKRIENGDSISMDGSSGIIYRGRLPRAYKDFVTGRTDISLEVFLKKVTDIKTIFALIEGLDRFAETTQNAALKRSIYSLISRLYAKDIFKLLSLRHDIHGAAILNDINMLGSAALREAIGALRTLSRIETNNAYIYLQLSELYIMLAEATSFPVVLGAYQAGISLIAGADAEEAILQAA